jgi:hypothetical protein
MDNVAFIAIIVYSKRDSEYKISAGVFYKAQEVEGFPVVQAGGGPLAAAACCHWLRYFIYLYYSS